MNPSEEQNIETGWELAVIGMAARFPGARDINEFWDNLKNGVESMVFFADREIKDAGYHSLVLENPDYIKSNGGMLKDKEYFDAFFFEYTPKEAELMNPQARIFHECAWKALEDAGYSSESYDGLIGLYAGGSSSLFWEGVSLSSGKSEEFGFFGAEQLTDKDFLSTRVSYNLNLRGPSFMINTACSTSLAAIHIACQELLSGQCDMALTGGVSLRLYSNKGYLYQEGMINSRDGHCRAFDARAKGTTAGEGVGIVVLKPLEDAVVDKDYIYAVIKGTAANNDGKGKVGYTAPSINGQAGVIKSCHRAAQVEAEHIGYVETHGTATILGDPIEFEALVRAFNTEKRNFCGIGSVKTNIGHLNTAAGIAGFIKTVLALKHRQIPPSLHFETPNPKIDLENSPFYMVTGLLGWKNDKYPLRAGVSSFGIGGTNVHVVLEEAPRDTRGLAPLHIEHDSHNCQLILLSAKTPTALEKTTTNLENFLKAHPSINLANVAYTLQVGRKAFKYRRMLTCSHRDEALELLSAANVSSLQTAFTNQENRPVLFMFPGQGAQYLNMGLDLYKSEPVFRQEMDRCFEILKPLMGYDIKEVLYPQSDCRGGSPCPPKDCVEPPSRGDHRGSPLQSDRINQTEIAQPLLFAVEYALATMLMKWGITPDAMIGHSIGEYVAACFAGVFPLEDTLKMVALRGKLMQQLPGGAMLSVSLSQEELKPLLSLNQDISLAAVNSPYLCVVSGPHQAVDTFARLLNQKGYKNKRLHTSHAFHSNMMEPILENFKDCVNQDSITLNQLKIPFISNLTGKMITAQEAVSPGYWVKHLREPVKFSEGVKELLKKEISLFIEVGPGRMLSTFVKQHQFKERDKNKEDNPVVVNLVRHPKEKVPDTYYLVSKLGEIWLSGKKIDWQAFYPDEMKQRIPLPTYPFEGTRCWSGEGAGINPWVQKPQLFTRKNSKEWFYIPTWERSPLTPWELPFPTQSPACWLLFIDKCGFGARLLKHLKQHQKEVITVGRGQEFAESSHNRYSINPQTGDHYDFLFQRLCEQDKIPTVIIHLWGITPDNDKELKSRSIPATLDSGFSSLIHIAQAIARENISNKISFGVVTNNLQEVTGDEVLSPEKAAVLAPIKIIPLEYHNITCKSIDIILPQPGSIQEDKFTGYLVREFAADNREQLIAYRGHHRWAQSFKTVPLDKSTRNPLLKEGSVCLVMGTHGDTVLATAQYLAKQVKAKLIVTLPAPLPHSGSLEKLRELENSGLPVKIILADISDRQVMMRIVIQAKKRFGRINGLFHTADRDGHHNGNEKNTREISPGPTSAIVAAKMKYILGIDQVLKATDTKPDFVILFSSIGTIVSLSQKGNVSQCAANDFLNAFAYYKMSKDNSDTSTLTVNDWFTPHEIALEWKDIINSALENRLPRVAVSPVDLKDLIRYYGLYNDSIHRREPGKNRILQEESLETQFMQRQGLSTQYKAPTNEIEQTLTNIWKRLFGIDNLGICDDFFQLGGDSLQAISMTNHIHKIIKVKIPIEVFFSDPTIEKLAQYISDHAQNDVYSPIQSAEKKEYYVLSSGQERFYILQQVNLKSTAYNLSGIYPIEMKLNRTQLKEVFKKIITQHEILRTSIEIVRDAPVQKVHGDVKFEIEYYNLGNGNSGEVLPNSIIKNFVRPFDLSQAPQFRVGLIQISEKNCLMLVDAHHIIFDAFSHHLLGKDFSSLYNGEDLPPLKLQYKDYAEWQHGEKVKQVFLQQEAYWLELLAGNLPTLELPLDYPRPETQNFTGDSIYSTIEVGATTALKQIAQEEGTTLHTVLLTVFYILLAKICSQEDIIIGVPVAARRHDELEKILGIFINMLPLRNFPSKEKSVISFLKEVKQHTLDALENQEYPFEKLVQKIAHKDVSRHPLCDVIFDFRPDDSNAAPGGKPGPSTTGPQPETAVGNTPGVTPPTENQFPLFLDSSIVDFGIIAQESHGAVYLVLGYSTKLFKKETAAHFLDLYQRIAASIIENKHVKINQIDLVAEEVKMDIQSTLQEDMKNIDIEFEF